MTLRKIRLSLAVVFFIGITLLFLDFTGTVHSWLGWMAKVQFLPALLALNVGVIIGLVALTLLFGRIYCSVICPLGVMQDIFAFFGKKAKKNRYTYSKPLNILRYIMLAVVVVAFILGLGWVVALFAPYSAYGRIASNLLAPVWAWGNNLLAAWAERHDSYAFYTVDIWLKGGLTLAVAIITLVALGILAWRNGRTYCNTVCPVGTILGFLSKYSLFRPIIDTKKCINCKLCERNCKASCINISGGHKFDYSRCVVCFDCIDRCPKGAISYKYGIGREKMDDKKTSDRRLDSHESADSSHLTPESASRRQFLTAAAVAAATATLKAQDKTVDGGLAAIVDKKIPERATRIVPPGAKSLRNLQQHCTACQLCVSVCPNGVLRPSMEIETFMQPESSYERGYCRPECTKCSEVCPAGAIIEIDRAEKSSIQIGHAVWVRENCIPLSDGVECGNCARHCPVGAILMVSSEADNPDSLKIPVVNEAICIGCGACENLCPARPFSAIYVEGHRVHRTI